MNEEIQTQNNKGFTLVEILVALAIFMLVMVVGISSLFTSNKSTKNTKALRFAMDNVNYAMDHMSRSLRLGSQFYCSTTNTSFPVNGGFDCVNGTDVFFRPAEHSIQDAMFRLEDGKVMKRMYVGSFNTDFVALTAPEVNVTELRFTVIGSEIFDAIQPSVLILLKGDVTIGGETHEFSLQTLASQRNAESE